MVFSSITFIFFFLPISILCYYILPEDCSNAYLLFISLLFYAFGQPKCIVILLASILISYIVGRILGLESVRRNLKLKRMALIAGILLNLALLFYFKYTNFFISTANDLFKTNIALRNIMLPLGISFFTFQSLSYIIDLYNGQAKVQKSFIKMALYISFFPKVTQGPITKYSDIEKQLDNRTYSVEKFSYGIQRFIVGLAKKVIIADNFGIVVDQIFAKQPNENTAIIAWIGAILYTLQIYFDFSGYSDMAIGLGKMFGFDFMENFNYPYISKSVTEFWRRWHISLSTWFKNYIYIPLGGNRKGNVYINSLIVFLVTGMWHGAAWNFIIWGMWHGAFLIIEKYMKKHNIIIKVPGVVKWIYCMLVVVLGWVLFRAPDFQYSLKYIAVMFGVVNTQQFGITPLWYLNNKVILLFIISLVAMVPIIKKIDNVSVFVNKNCLKKVICNILLFALFFISIMCVMTSTYNAFIYFKF